MNRLNPPTHLSARRRWSAGRLLAWTLLIGMLLVTLAPLWMVIKTGLLHPHALYAESTALWPSEFRKLL